MSTRHFMNDYYNKINELLKGRYSRIDELNKFILYIILILIFINLIFKNIFIRLIIFLLFILYFYRFFSKKIYIRAHENTVYLNILKKIKNIFKRKIKDKNHIYKKCHHCRTILKFEIPYEIGIKHSKCPKCKKRNTFIILRKQKVEIIKNRKNN